MVVSGLPDLRQSKDVAFIRCDMHNVALNFFLIIILSLTILGRDVFCLENTKEEALLKFRKAMKKALEKSRLVNIKWFRHNVA